MFCKICSKKLPKGVYRCPVCTYNNGPKDKNLPMIDTTARVCSDDEAEVHSEETFETVFEEKSSSPTWQKFAEFSAAIKNYFKNYFTFKGKATAKEYWYALLFAVLSNLILYLLSFIIDGDLPDLLLFTSCVANLIPLLSVTSRRFNDLGYGRFRKILSIFSFFIPFIGLFSFIFIMSHKSKDKPIYNYYI